MPLSASISWVTDTASSSSMAQPHLRELLNEEQPPFRLQEYISERRRQLNRPPLPLLNEAKNAKAIFRAGLLGSVLEKLASHVRRKITHKEVEDKEHSSPVSVLDRLFREDHEERSEELDGRFQKLLQTLGRFEKLAELDSVEMGRVAASDEEEEREDDGDRLVMEVMVKTGFCNAWRDCRWFKRLVSDLIEEDGKEEGRQSEGVVDRVCGKLEWWREECSTIDVWLMAWFDDGWNGMSGCVNDSAVDIEFRVLALLVEELVDELVSFDVCHSNI